jgi:hypothetical protein
VESDHGGSLKDHSPLNHPAWYTKDVQGGSLDDGCRVGTRNYYDKVGFKCQNISGDGYFIWNIPWTYQVGVMPPKVFTTLTQEMRNIGDKLSTASKNGITVERTID